jgi:hypothetical protein
MRISNFLNIFFYLLLRVFNHTLKLMLSSQMLRYFCRLFQSNLLRKRTKITQLFLFLFVLKSDLSQHSLQKLLFRLALSMDLFLIDLRRGLENRLLKLSDLLVLKLEEVKQFLLLIGKRGQLIFEILIDINLVLKHFGEHCPGMPILLIHDDLHF